MRLQGKLKKDLFTEISAYKQQLPKAIITRAGVNQNGEVSEPWSIFATEQTAELFFACCWNHKGGSYKHSHFQKCYWEVRKKNREREREIRIKKRISYIYMPIIGQSHLPNTILSSGQILLRSVGSICRLSTAVIQKRSYMRLIHQQYITGAPHVSFWI